MTTTPKPQPPLRHRLAGIFTLAGLIIQILSFAMPSVPTPIVSVLLWSSVALMWRDIPRRNQLQAGSLAAFGILMLVVARWVYGASIDILHVLDGNVFVAAMLVGVSFIALIGRPTEQVTPTTRPITGRRGIAGTWLGVHLLGAILNLSTVFMIGDRLERRGPLSDPQLLGLNRGLSSAALWSPFFASMGVVITLAPGLDYTDLVSLGLPLALFSGLFTVVELSRRFDVQQVPGFSLAPRSLLMPVSMAAMVMLFHYVLTPGLTIVSIITLLMPSIALLANLTRGGVELARTRITRHVHYRLPAMRGEITLFLCAGLLTKGLSDLVDAATQGDWTLFPDFGTVPAMASYVAIVISAIAGLHPIIGVSILASMLQLDGTHQTLFGFVALSSWAVGTSVGPLSGINLSLQGRYGVSGYRMMRYNLLYALIMSGLVLAGIAWLARGLDV
ncbi:hypothetical protein [Halomonas huangheensis]|uniref:Citrate transporter-like domain-containing protein n=1 Tax=Halomonas huangheensis TaxID=1178482 RepID=W1N2T9_9GAMM|nr:hypothetical protein [Halomonas huangheensis]ALM52273.1 hypothetical protein AR456_08210 [Halomonas huangheensis]ERL49501.1 hypothetical protein BJB45_06890 [Halomonas huangheensis]